MQQVLDDVRHALRLLGRHRGFAIVSVLTLGLGIGANSAMFAMVHGVLLRDLPYPDPGSLVAIHRTTPQGEAESHAAADYLDVERETHRFAALAPYRMDVVDLSARGGDPERVSGAQVGVAFFDVLGRSASAGRVFSAKRDDPRGARLVVLGDAIWQRRFGGDSRVVGSTIRVNREPCTVVGVMPRELRRDGPSGRRRRGHRRIDVATARG